jgi:YidC/Oxa1 family membrane protein insertase
MDFIVQVWQTFIGFIEQGLLLLSQGIAGLGIPYSFGFAIILFTLIIRGITFPLDLQQIKSSRAQKDLQPKLKALKEKYKNNREAFAQAQMALYKEHGVNPMSGCLPTLIQMPIWIGLYRALYALAKMPNTPLKGGFLWIPSLAGPIDLLSKNPRTTGWLLPNSDHFLGWSHAAAYLVLPVILVVLQLYTQKIMAPQIDDARQGMMSKITMFMPLMFGYFSLTVPSALTLYWVTSNTLILLQRRLVLKHQETRYPSEPDTDSSLELKPIVVDGTSQTGHRNRRKVKLKSKKRKRKRL